MIETFRFLRLALIAWKKARTNGIGAAYVALESHGVPQLTVHVSIGREAWRTTDYAIATHRLLTR
jgi:hypothetical protein